ncbi:hypothetical protein KSS87_023175 [Heliosperma pusillum]|nr:hypothetical protein KSS87_023175 [Heliosperma pusillum]
MVDAVVNVFLEKLLNALENEGRILFGYGDHFQKLQSELQYMRSFLKDAERLKRKNETLRCALADLRELVYEAEDILADCELLSNRTNSGNSYFLTKVRAKYHMTKRLGQINERITGIKEKITSYVRPQLISDSRDGSSHEEGQSRWSSPVYDHTQVVGLEGDTRKLKEWLFQADDGLLSIGIVGMGGLGKTTLAQTVFNDKEMEHHFEKRIWVSVSQTFTEEQILRSILRNLGDANIGDDLGDLLKRINHHLLGKRFLIVMDDVWCEDTSWWLKIYEGLPKGSGSCVIVTTRNEGVARKMRVQEARIHRPKVLCESDSWLLFCNVAFANNNGNCTSDDLESIGKELVSKCRGLPLAIKAVGGMMLCKRPYYHEWKRIADHFRDELADNDSSVMASLQLSYDELPSYLKSCFLSLSIYPEDCEISKDQLTRWWVGEGFVPVRNGRLATEAGENCFSGLTNRCLVEVVEWDYNGKISTCKVHDMVRDLVIKIANDDTFARLTTADCRHFGINTNITQNHDITVSQKLRALISTVKSGEVNKIDTYTGNKFCDFRYLRVLDMSKSVFKMSIGALLGKVGCLKHLTCLNLSNTHPLTQLPESLEKLHHLQILDLSYCQSLKSLPPFLMNFKNIVVLDVSHCGSLECLPRNLESLSKLQVLLGFKPARPGKVGSSLSDLRNLSQLRTLELQLTRADEINDRETDALTGLKELQSLTINCFNSFERELVNKLEKLHPPSNLHELSLKFYPGKTSPKWLNPTSLPMLSYLSITGGNLASFEETFWACGNSSWKIEGLKLDSLSHLRLDWETTKGVMPALRIVHAHWCPELKLFPIEGVGFRGGVWKQEHNS